MPHLLFLFLRGCTDIDRVVLGGTLLRAAEKEKATVRRGKAEKTVLWGARWAPSAWARVDATAGRTASLGESAIGSEGLRFGRRERAQLCGGGLLVSAFPKSAKKPIICALGIDKMGEKWYNIQDCKSPTRRGGEKGARFRSAMPTPRR